MVEVRIGMAYAQSFSHKPELLLDCLPRRDLPRRAICAEQVPGIEAGEVLQCSEELISADGRRDEL